MAGLRTGLNRSIEKMRDVTGDSYNECEKQLAFIAGRLAPPLSDETRAELTRIMNTAREAGAVFAIATPKELAFKWGIDADDPTESLCKSWLRSVYLQQFAVKLAEVTFKVQHAMSISSIVIELDSLMEFGRSLMHELDEDL